MRGPPHVPVRMMFSVSGPGLVHHRTMNPKRQSVRGIGAASVSIPTKDAPLPEELATGYPAAARPSSFSSPAFAQLPDAAPRRYTVGMATGATRDGES